MPTTEQLHLAAIKFATTRPIERKGMEFLAEYLSGEITNAVLADQWELFIATEFPRYWINLRTKEGTNPAFVETDRETFDKLCNGHILRMETFRSHEFYVYHGRGTAPDGSGDYVEMIRSAMLYTEPSDKALNFIVEAVDNSPR
jgi:hypothetical protein